MAHLLNCVPSACRSDHLKSSDYDDNLYKQKPGSDPCFSCSGIAHFLQGSVAEYVTKHASVPVTTVRESDVATVKLNLDGSACAAGQGA